MTDETYSEFTTAIDDRFLDDYPQGARYRFGVESVDADEIVEFVTTRRASTRIPTRRRRVRSADSSRAAGRRVRS